MWLLSFDCGLYNLAWTIFHIENKNKYSVYDWGIISLNSGKKKTDFEYYNRVLLEKLIELFQIHDFIPHFEYVLIENQTTISPTNKNISVIIYTFFNMLAINTKHIEIKFISPSNKLKVANKPELPIFNIKNKYQIRKKTAIIYAEYYLVNVLYDNEKFLEFQKNNKRDDLADSLLQGIYFIENSIP